MFNCLKTNLAPFRGFRTGAVVLFAAAALAACGGEAPKTEAPKGGDAPKEAPKADDGKTVKIGILHSLSGAMAISETSLRDVVLMAVDEINAKGGVMGKMIEPVVVNPDLNWPLFNEKAKQLLLTDKVKVVFGCWTSVSRKSVLETFESNNGLLFYPVQYEGQEESKNIFYTGATPNQQLIPAAEYMRGKEGGNKKKFYLLGTDYVFPRTANMVLKAYLKAQGVPDANIVEEYTAFDHSDYQTIVGKIKKFGAAGDATVLSTINGSSNVPFYKEFAKQGLKASQIPIMAFSVAEDELRPLAGDTPLLVGHLAAWNYFQSIDTPENKEFVAAFKKYAADKKLPDGDKRVTDDPMEAAYFGVKVWAAAVEKAQSFDVDKVTAAVLGMEFKAPGGPKHMNAKNHHTAKPVYIGKIQADGQFEIVSKYNDGKLVEPESFSQYLPKNAPAWQPPAKAEEKKAEPAKTAEPAKK